MYAKCLLALGAVVLVLAPLGADDKDKKDDAKFDPAKIAGTWSYVSGERDGKKVPEANLKKGSVEITKDTITLKGDDTYVMKYSLDPKKTPCRITIEITKGPQGEGAKAEGIIALKGDELKLCYNPMGGEAPKDFATKEGSNLHLFILKPKK
jgi:uncharacterized protein (TIGR03067 family)